MRFWNKWRAITQKIKTELAIYQRVLKDPRTPRLAKWLLALAVGYALLPFDLIPDFIPILGQLDDLIIIPILVMMAVKIIPPQVIGEAREACTVPQHGNLNGLPES